MFADTASHQAVLAARLRRTMHGFVRVPEPQPVRIEVMNGLQASCIRAARTSDLTIGSAVMSDLMLLDSGVAENAVSLVFSNSLFGNLVSVRNLGAQVSVDGNDLAQGDAAEHCTLPLSLIIDGISLHIAPQKVVAEVPKSRFDRILQNATAAVLVFAIAVAGLLIADGTRDRVLRYPGADQPDVGPPTTQIAFAGQLREKIVASGLAERIDVQALQEGGVRVAGEVPIALRSEWDQLKIWFEGLPDAPMLVSNVSAGSAEMTLPPIMMVRLSAPRALYLATGEILNVTDAMENGWSVQDIGLDKVMFARGTEIIEYSLEGSE
jgi:hypothetical protein